MIAIITGNEAHRRHPSSPSGSGTLVCAPRAARALREGFQFPSGCVCRVGPACGPQCVCVCVCRSGAELRFLLKAGKSLPPNKVRIKARKIYKLAVSAAPSLLVFLLCVCFPSPPPHAPQVSFGPGHASPAHIGLANVCFAE